ncbi:MAG TPA: hypothetical protein VG076_05365 [Acidimicrobiales bacterium]|jgi:hypothetical protein|nr:hypothetical protein [Acidimicrobiales bacterium]
MDAQKALRPLTVVAAAGLLLTGAACNGPLARRAARSQTPAPAMATTTVAPAAPAAAPPTTLPPSGGPSATAPVRTDDLDAGLQQADTQLSQTGGAVGDADQNPQQNSD